MKYHWTIVYPQREGVYTAFGITGYQSPTLSIGRNSMLNEPAGALFTLTVTSYTSGRDETYPVLAIVSGFTLTVVIYNQCQTETEPCSNPGARPAPAGTT